MTKELTHTRIESLKAKAKPYKVSDGGGLHLLVTPAGGKLWRLSYRVRGASEDGSPVWVQKTMALGAYDREANGLEEARARRAKAKLTLKAGRDPARTAPALDGQATFEQLAREWHKHNEDGWAPKYGAQILTRLEEYVFPEIGKMPVSQIKRSDIRDCLDKVVARGIVETAHRLKQYIGAILRFSEDDAVVDSTPGLKGKLKKRPKVSHFKSLKANEIGPFLVALDESHCERETRWAMLLTILTAGRTSEVLGACWEEFEDLKYPAEARWRIPEGRMKKGREHIVPLSRQAQSVLKALRERTGRSEHLFPGRSGFDTMSNNTMLFHCYAMGYRNKTTMHGFRSSFSTIANESGLWAPDVIELALSHDEDDEMRAAYNSAQHLPKRRELLQWWADQLDAMRRQTLQERRIQS